MAEYQKKTRFELGTGSDLADDAAAGKPRPEVDRTDKKEIGDGVMDELKPCPFCGHKSALRSGRYVTGEEKPGTAHVVCTHCGSTTVVCNDKAEAVERWNQRA